MRQLFWMARGKMKSDWSMASSIMALIANVNKGSKQKAYTPYDFMPDFCGIKKEQNRIPYNPKTLDDVMRRVFPGEKKKQKPGG